MVLLFTVIKKKSHRLVYFVMALRVGVYLSWPPSLMSLDFLLFEMEHPKTYWKSGNVLDFKKCEEQLHHKFKRIAVSPYLVLSCDLWKPFGIESSPDWSYLILLIAFCDSRTGVGPRALILGLGGSSRELLWCLILVMVRIRRPAIISLMVSRSLWCTMSKSWNSWWCTTGSLLTIISFVFFPLLWTTILGDLLAAVQLNQ